MSNRSLPVGPLAALVLWLAIHPAMEAAAQVTPFTVWTSEARRSLPVWVQYWMYFMFLMAGLGVPFLRAHVEARWAVGAFALTHVLSGLQLLLVGKENFTVGMIAVNHCVVWTPAAWRLATSLRAANVRSAFGIWLVCMLGVFTFSLVFDFRDAFLFLFGARPLTGGDTEIGPGWALDRVPPRLRDAPAALDAPRDACNASTMKTVTIRDLRHRWPETEKALAREGEILITRDAKPVAKLVWVDPAFESRARLDPEEHAAWQRQVGGRPAGSTGHSRRSARTTVFPTLEN